MPWEFDEEEFDEVTTVDEFIKKTDTLDTDNETATTHAKVTKQRDKTSYAAACRVTPGEYRIMMKLVESSEFPGIELRSDALHYLVQLGLESFSKKGKSIDPHIANVIKLQKMYGEAEHVAATIAWESKVIEQAIGNFQQSVTDRLARDRFMAIYSEMVENTDSPALARRLKSVIELYS